MNVTLMGGSKDYWQFDRNICRKRHTDRRVQSTHDDLTRLYAVNPTHMARKPHLCAVDGKPNAQRVAEAAKGYDAPRASGTPGPDATIMALAAKQQGVVARAQLVELEVPVHAIDYRLKKGRLNTLHRGVYRVGPVPAAYEREMGAVLACGETALLSHRSAAALWNLLPRPKRGAPIEVSVQQRRRKPGPGVRVRLAKVLGSDEKTHKHGIPTTAPARTILDLAGSVGARELEQAMAAAIRLRLAEIKHIEELLARYPRRAGAPIVRALLSREAGSAFTRSEAESRFLALIRRAKLREPEVNVQLEGYEVDFLWRREKLVIEIDGFAYHSSPSSFERDRRRDAVLAATGFRVIRATWRQLTGEPEALLVVLAQALARAAGS